MTKSGRGETTAAIVEHERMTPQIQMVPGKRSRRWRLESALDSDLAEKGIVFVMRSGKILPSPES